MPAKTLFKHPTEKATVFKNPNSHKLYMSFYYEGRRIQKSTKTDDLETAIKVLEQTLSNNIIFQENDIKKNYVEKTKVSEVANAVIRELEITQQPASYKEYVRACKTVIAKIGNIQIDNVDRVAMKVLFDEPLSKTTVQYRRQALRRIFDHAEDTKLIKYRPSFPKPVYKETNAREAIEHQQFLMLMEHWRAKVFEKSHTRVRKLVEVINAEKMYEFIILAYSSGMRVGEMLYLKGKDIKLSKRTDDIFYYTITIRKSKVNKDKAIKRKILVETEVARFFYEKYTLKRPNDYIFYNVAREKVITPHQIVRDDKKTNNQWYAENRLLDFVAYRLRHSFITRKILEGRNLIAICQHTGTSLQMLNDFYASIINTKNYTTLFDEQTELQGYERKHFDHIQALQYQHSSNRYIDSMNRADELAKAEALEDYQKKKDIEIFAEEMEQQSKLYGAQYRFKTEELMEAQQSFESMFKEEGIDKRINRAYQADQAKQKELEEQSDKEFDDIVEKFGEADFDLFESDLDDIRKHQAEKQ